LAIPYLRDEIISHRTDVPMPAVQEKKERSLAVHDPSSVAFLHFIRGVRCDKLIGL
jgi:hypothetical protein